MLPFFPSQCKMGSGAATGPFSLSYRFVAAFGETAGLVMARFYQLIVYLICYGSW